MQLRVPRKEKSKEVFEKIIEELKKESIIVDNDAGNRAVEIIERVAAEHDGWIRCSERLPEEPEKTGDVEDDIYDGKLTEYIVIIYGAEKPTTLYYAGDGDWYDGNVTRILSRITAWQPLPEPYQKGE